MAFKCSQGPDLTVSLEMTYLPKHNQTNVHLWGVINTSRSLVLCEFSLFLPGFWSKKEVHCRGTRGRDLQIEKNMPLAIHEVKDTLFYIFIEWSARARWCKKRKEYSKNNIFLCTLRFLCLHNRQRMTWPVTWIYFIHALLWLSSYFILYKAHMTEMEFIRRIAFIWEKKNHRPC